MWNKILFIIFKIFFLKLNFIHYKTATRVDLVLILVNTKIPPRSTLNFITKKLKIWKKKIWFLKMVIKNLIYTSQKSTSFLFFFFEIEL